MRPRNRRSQKGVRVSGHKARRVKKCIGESRSKEGKLAEKHFFDAHAAEVSGQPRWWRGIRRATKTEDKFQKIDAVIATDIQNIAIQIKNTKLGLQHFQKWQRKTTRPWGKYIVCIIVQPDMTFEQIRAKTYTLVGEMRKTIIREKRNT